MKSFFFVGLLFLGITLISSQTTPSPTTTSPSGSNNTAINHFNYTSPKDNAICLMVTLEAYFNKSGNIVNVTSDAEMINSSSSCGKLAVKFGQNNFTLTFENNSRMYWLHQIDCYIEQYDTNATLTDQNLGNTTLKSSYLCNTGFTLNLSDNVTITATNVQFQAIQVTGGTYGVAQSCSADIGNNIIIPIAVGCALVGLIIIVLIAYMIGRKHAKHRYEAM